MSRTLPTERLTRVVAEATINLSLLNGLRLTVSQIVRDWGVMPQEVILAELREALDLASTYQVAAIPEALAYLQLNSKRLETNRNLARRSRGLGPRDYDAPLRLPATSSPAPSTMTPILSLADIEDRLKGLNVEED